ncbi:hypothetical protein CBR_g6679 [Chara braunii]|uniref:Zinc finger CHCC-type domain-containing protein n=1 Tax=Chara braunii TaxID=69332 RepID=A0A388KKR4_CHABU|nr:hypothetical protein CBR_g6679 [Chara braunii]|eukprot:GBG70553.1 hypothetical protein CBR_g6679 [Chara braunii]
MSRVSRFTVGCARAIARSARADVAATSSRAGVIGFACESPRVWDCVARSAREMQLGWFPRSVFTASDHTSKWMPVAFVFGCFFFSRCTNILIACGHHLCPDAFKFLADGKDPALGHPVEYINLDSAEPAVCKYCGLRYVQKDHH